MKVKYVRVSTDNQSLDRQVMDRGDYDRVYADQISGSVPMSMRPMGKQLIEDIENGKVNELCVSDAARIGRDALDVHKTLRLCEERGVNVVITDLGIQSIVNGKRNDMFSLVSGIILSLAEAEKRNIIERCNQGREAARRRGVVFGRKEGWKESRSAFLSKEKPKLIMKYLQKGYSWSEIMKLVNVSKTLIYKTKQYMNNEVSPKDLRVKEAVVENVVYDDYDEYEYVKPITWATRYDKPTGMATWVDTKKKDS